jgi:hypothetical protein
MGKVEGFALHIGDHLKELLVEGDLFLAVGCIQRLLREGEQMRERECVCVRVCV